MTTSTPTDKESVAAQLLQMATFDHAYEELLKRAAKLLTEPNTPSEGPSKTKLPASPDVGGGPVLST